MKHSKLPWTIVERKYGHVYINSDKQQTIVSEHSLTGGRADAEFIVTACNYHQDLIDACHNLLRGTVRKESVFDMLDEIERIKL